MGDINNQTSPPTSTPAYFDFYNTHSTGLGEGTYQTFSFELRAHPSFKGSVRIWIDWDSDQEFDYNEIIHDGVHGFGTVTITDSFQVPTSFDYGVKRLRIGTEFVDAFGPAAPCESHYGEFEDYKVVLTRPGMDLTASSYSPQSFAKGKNPLKVEYANLGNQTIDSFEAGYKLVNLGTGNVTKQVDTIADTTLGLGGVYVHNFDGPDSLNIPQSGNYRLKIWGSGPNNQAQDIAPGNDTISKVIYTTLEGLYTINPVNSGPRNFKSFNAAVKRLKLGNGVSGPVTFEVAPGTYNEQVVIPDFGGTSTSNTVTFDGINPNTTELTNANTTYDSAHTLLLNTTQHINIKNLSITTSGTNQGVPLKISNNPNSFNVVTQDILIRNCHIEVKGPGANSQSENFKCIDVSGNLEPDKTHEYGYTLPINQASFNNIKIDSNRLIGGAYGILLNDQTSNTLITNNKIRKAYDAGIAFGDASSWKINHNDIRLRKNQGFGVGIFGLNSNSRDQNFNTIIGNRIYNTHNKGVHLIAASNLGQARGKIINNMIGGGFSSATSHGMFLEASNYDIYFNTINLDYATQSPENAALSIRGGGHDIRNNNLAYSSNQGSGIPLYVRRDPDFEGTVDYNNYHNNSGGSLFSYDGQMFTDSTIEGGRNLNYHAFSDAPGFVSDSNLYLAPNTGLPSGNNSFGVQYDIDGNPRCLQAPTVGADEADFSLNTPVQADFEVPDTVYAKSNTRFLNRVADDVPADFHWLVNGDPVGYKKDLTYSFVDTGLDTVTLKANGCGSEDSVTKIVDVVDPVRIPPRILLQTRPLL